MNPPSDVTVLSDNESEPLLEAALDKLSSFFTGRGAGAALRAGIADLYVGVPVTVELRRRSTVLVAGSNPLLEGGVLDTGLRVLLELRRGVKLGSRLSCFRLGEEFFSGRGTVLDLESVAAGVFGLPDIRGLLATDDTGLAGTMPALVGGLPPPLPPLFLRSKGGTTVGLAEDRPPVVSPSRRVLISGGTGILCTVLTAVHSVTWIIRYSFWVGGRQHPGKPLLKTAGFCGFKRAH